MSTFDTADWIPTTGRIVYDPPRPGMKSRTTNWCVANVDNDITRYYRWWLEREKHVFLHQPAWGGHVSIVRGERISPKLQAAWKKRHNQRIELEYRHGIINVSPDTDAPGEFYWISARSEAFDEIRQELGLPTGWSYHITIGRRYY